MGAGEGGEARGSSHMALWRLIELAPPPLPPPIKDSRPKLTRFAHDLMMRETRAQVPQKPANGAMLGTGRAQGTVCRLLLAISWWQLSTEHNRSHNTLLYERVFAYGARGPLQKKQRTTSPLKPEKKGTLKKTSHPYKPSEHGEAWMVCRFEEA